MATLYFESGQERMVISLAAQMRTQCQFHDKQTTFCTEMMTVTGDRDLSITSDATMSTAVTAITSTYRTYQRLLWCGRFSGLHGQEGQSMEWVRMWVISALLGPLGWKISLPLVHTNIIPECTADCLAWQIFNPTNYYLLMILTFPSSSYNCPHNTNTVFY